LAATRIVERIGGESNKEKQKVKVAALWALTSFEFFDAVAQSCGDMQQAAGIVLELARKAVA